MVLILPNAGIAAPIPDDFDFAAHLIIPPALDPTGWPIRIRCAHNCKVEIFNEDSLAATMNCRDNREAFPDIGPPLMALYPYSMDEFTLLAASPQLCEKVGPLPTFIIMEVERIRLQKDTRHTVATTSSAITTKSLPVAGSMVLLKPVERISGQQPKTIVSDVFLYSIREKFFLPINWFTNERLQLAQHRLHDLHTKVHRTEPTSQGSSSEVKVQVFDMVKMSTLWGDDKDHTCLSPMKWLECMSNYLAALVTLSPAFNMELDGTALPIFSFAVEFNKHLDFFQNYPDFEKSYPIWYAFERTARNDILEGILFSRDYYVQNLAILIQVRDQVKLITASLMQSPPPLTKRTADSDLHGGTAAKAPRTVANDSPQSFRNSDPPKRTSAPTCIICASSHLLRLHPVATVTFNDGKPCFSVYQDSELRTLKTLGSSKEAKRICIPYNLASGCKHQHDDGRLHICSLCGREHSALSRSASCLRVFEGAIRA